MNIWISLTHHDEAFSVNIVFFLFVPFSFSASLIARGVAVGLPSGAVAKPGFVVQNIGIYFSEPQGEKPSTNVMADVPVFEYNTKTRWFDNQFRFVLAPAFAWEKSGSSWHYGTPSPIGLVGLIREILPGLGFGGYVGGAAPLPPVSA